MTFTPEQLQHKAAWLEHSCMRWENRTPSVSCAVAGEELCGYCTAAAMLRAGAEALAREQAHVCKVTLGGPEMRWPFYFEYEP